MTTVIACASAGMNGGATSWSTVSADCHAFDVDSECVVVGSVLCMAVLAAG
jgi:hypothetical protein